MLDQLWWVWLLIALIFSGMAPLGVTGLDLMGPKWTDVKGGEILGHAVSMVRINVRLSGQHKCHVCYP